MGAVKYQSIVTEVDSIGEDTLFLSMHFLVPPCDP